jgi:hypothetical protein
MPTCLEYNEERTQTCDDMEDQGYNDCASWNPWVAWLCISWTWVSHWVCVGYTWTTTSVCILWDTTVTIVDAIIVTLESIGLGWILNVLAAIVGLIFVIPVIGPIIQWIWNVVLTAASAIFAIPDIVSYAVGIRPQKKLRVCAIILVDSKGNPVAANADVVSALNTAIEIYFREMNVIIIRSAPFQYSTGFIHPPPADESWITLRQLGDDQLTACCNACMAGEDLWLKGSSKKLEIMQDCFWGNWRRIVGIGAPVAIFVVQSMESRTVTFSDGTTGVGQTIGCGLSVLTDFIVVAQSAPALGISNALQSSPEATAHELGHICTLWHLTGANDITNLMFANENALVDANGAPLANVDTALFDWQAQLVRASRHVSYF